MRYCVVVRAAPFEYGVERIEMSILTVRLTEREERDLQLACEQTGKANLQETLTKSHLRYKIHSIKQGAR
jgi:hypothetical protein